MARALAIAKTCSTASTLGGLALVVGLCLAARSYPATRASNSSVTSINADTDAAIGHFEARVTGIDSLIGRSQGILVLPTVGASTCLRHQASSPGILRASGQPQQNYMLDTGTIDLECDHHPVSLFILFMNKQALDLFVSRMRTSSIATETGARPLFDTVGTPGVLTYILLDNGIVFGTRCPIRAYRSAPSSSKA